MEKDLSFIAPEGVYLFTEEHRPPHSQTTNATPIPYPTRLSWITVKFPTSKFGNQGFASLLGGGKEGRGKDKHREYDKEDRTGRESVSSSDNPDEVAQDPQPDLSLPPPPSEPHIPQFPPTLFSSSATSGKKKSISRPKHNIRTTSSSFVTRLHSAEGLTKALQAKTGETTFLFYNSAKSFFWTEAGVKAKEPLARITFSAHPTCHDVNAETSTFGCIDIVIGFSTGDLMWFDPMSSRYLRINKAGSISSSPCTAVRWVPSSKSIFLASHADGTIIVYDREREDGAFTPLDPTNPFLNTSPFSTSTGHLSSTSEVGSDWNPLDEIFVSRNPHGASGVLKNPVSHWRISKRSIIDFIFSPELRYFAAISDDGCLRVIDALSERLVDTYASYFGSLTCLAWSPDGRFIITGGQDDLITIFSPWEQRVIARCHGHSSFVSSVAFDGFKCDGRTYRFGSVGEDNKFILWDFSSGALHRPKLLSSQHQRLSLSSTISLALRRPNHPADRSALHLPGVGSPSGNSHPRYHPAPSRNDVALLQPVVVKPLEGEILNTLAFLPSAVLSITKAGIIKVWVRPLSVRPRPLRKKLLSQQDS